MQIRCDAVLAFPRPLVWTTYRDRLVDLVPYLPNIRGIEVKERAVDASLADSGTDVNIPGAGI